MKITITFVWLVTLLATESIAQTPVTDKPKKSFYLNAVTGIAAPDFANVNTELQKAGYLPLNKLYLVRGAGFYTIFPKIRLATIFNFSTFTAQNTEQSKGNWVRATTYGTSLGFVIRNDTKIQLIPYAGLSYCLFGVRVSNVSPTSNTFSGYVTSPANQHQLSLNQLMAGLGIHVAKSQLSSGKLGQKIAVGVRTGYSVPLGNAKWKTDNVTLSESPTANPGGFYANLTIGILQ